MPAARAVGKLTWGRACLRVRGDCQNTASRPRAVVKTSWDRFSRNRAATMSMAAPRRMHDCSGTRSTISGSSGHSLGGDRVAVEGFGARPGPRGAQHDALAERDPHQVGEGGVGVGVGGDQQFFHRLAINHS